MTVNSFVGSLLIYKLIQLQGRDLRNDSTLSDLEILDGCTLKITVPQWWAKIYFHVLQRRHATSAQENLRQNEPGFARRAEFYRSLHCRNQREPQSHVRGIRRTTYKPSQQNQVEREKFAPRCSFWEGARVCVANILMNGGKRSVRGTRQNGRNTSAYGGEIVRRIRRHGEIFERLS